jgi:hypothetical protein
VTVKRSPSKVTNDVSGRVHHEALQQAEKQVSQRAPELIHTVEQIRIVHEVEMHRSEPQVEEVSQIEINNLIAWQKQNAESHRASFAQTGIVETVQAEAVPERPEVMEATVQKLEVPQRIIQPADTTDRNHDLIDAVPQVNVEPILTEGEHIETTTISGLEVQALPGGIDIEEATQQDKAEYMGELLVAMFEGLAETESIVDAEIVPAIAEAATFQGIEEEFGLDLESLQPRQVETTNNILEELRIVLKEIQQPSEETTTEEKEIMELRLEELCIQLFEVVGLGYDKEIVHKFIQTMTEQESSSNRGFEPDQLYVDELNYLGTREYKPLGNATLLGGLTQFIKHKMQSRLVLGRYALQVSQPTH